MLDLRFIALITMICLAVGLCAVLLIPWNEQALKVNAGVLPDKIEREEAKIEADQRWYEAEIAANVARLETVQEEANAETEEAKAETLKAVKEQAKVQQQIASIPFWSRFGKTTAAGSALILAGAVIGLSMAIHAKLTTHVFRFKNAEIPVKDKDLSRIAPEVAFQLSLAERIEAEAPDRALQIYTQLAETNTRQITALVGKRGVFGNTHTLPALAAGEPQQAINVPAPTFQELLQHQEIAPGKPLIFGMKQDGELRKGTWQDLFSAALGGKSGKGKTNSLRSIMAQSLLQAIDFWVVDLHFPHPDSLLASLGSLKDCGHIQYADTKFQVNALLEEVDKTIENRLKGREDYTMAKVLIIDEVLSLMRKLPKTADIIERIGEEGRKVNVFGMFSAQSWLAKDVGSSAVRDNLTSRICHELEPQQARTFLQHKPYVDQVIELPKGQALFVPTEGKAELLSIPYCSPADMDIVYQYVMEGNTVKQVVKPAPRKQVLMTRKLTPAPGLDEFFEDMADESATDPKLKSNVVAFPNRQQEKTQGYAVTTQEESESLPSPELTLELLKANMQASGLTKTDWTKQFSEKAGISESLLKLILLGHRNITQETIEKVLPHITKQVVTG